MNYVLHNISKVFEINQSNKHNTDNNSYSTSLLYINKYPV